MEFFIKVAMSPKNGSKYRALVVRRGTITRTVTFDVETLLLVTGWTYETLYSLECGEYKF